MSRRHPTPMLAAMVAAALLAGCGDDAEPVGTTTTVVVPEASTTTVDEEGLAAIEALVQSLLVQANELGDGGYEDQGYSPGTTVAFCSDALASSSPDVLAGTAATSATAATTVVEELRVYPSEAEATAAFDAAAAGGGSCGTPADVNTNVGADAAVAFAADDPSSGTFVVARVADTVLAFHVIGLGLDPLEVAAFGAGKVLAALEG